MPMSDTYVLMSSREKIQMTKTTTIRICSLGVHFTFLIGCGEYKFHNTRYDLLGLTGKQGRPVWLVDFFDVLKKRFINWIVC